MAINERLIDTEVAEAGNGGAGNAGEEGLILHLDANDVDSYDGDGSEWIDITNHEYKPATNISEHFNTVTYTGNNSSNSITGVGFQPDLVWVKNRTNANSHNLIDSVRGATKVIYSNLVNNEDTRSNSLTSFDSDGFSLGNYVGVNGNYNYVAWCFKAGGAAVSNTDGTVTSQVSANNDLGFSIVKHTGTSSNTSIGHGLGIAPELIITKNTTDDSNWSVNGSVGGLVYGTNKLQLNTTAVLANDYNEVLSANGTTFTVGGSGATNGSNDAIIHYCFASKRGVSKVGSYTGNGSTSTGNTINLGFEPAFIMIKNTSTTGSSSGWFMIDNKRNTSDPTWNKYIFANDSVAEATTTASLTSVGATSFTVKSSGRAINYNGDNYIYYAVAKDTNAGSLTPSTDGTEIETDLIFDPTQVHYSSTNYALEQDNTIWKGNASKSGGTHEGEVYFNNYFKSGDTGKYYFEVKLLEGTHFGVAFTDPTKYNPRSATDTGNAQDDRYFYGLNNNNLINSNGTNVNVNSTFASISNGDTISVAIDVATRKIWFGEVSGGTITWYGSGNPSSGTNEASVLPSGWNIYQPLVADTAYSGSSARYAWWQLNRTASATTLPTGFSYMTGAIKNADLELHLDASTYTSGSTWTDSSGNGNDGTITGATHNDELGDWFDFDGVNDIITTTYDVASTGAKTIEFWFNDNGYISTNNTYPSPVGGDDTAIWTGGNLTGSYSDESLGFYNATNGLHFYIRTGTNTYRDNKWHHVAITDNGSNAHAVYVDGESHAISYLAGSATTRIQINNVRIGKGDDGTGLYGYYFNGQVGQVRIYSTALTQDQVRQNFNFTKNDYPNGYNGTISGATWNSNGYFDFDGSNDYIDLGDIKGTGNELTVSAWINPDSTQSNAYATVFDFEHSNDEGWVLYQDNTNTNNYKVALKEGSVWDSTSNISLSSGNWHHIAFTIDSNNDFELYVNNTNIQSLQNWSGLGTAERRLNLGCWGGNNGTTRSRFWNGQMTEIKVYDKALTQAEITALYNEGE